jgi:hypothetical protein
MYAKNSMALNAMLFFLHNCNLPLPLPHAKADLESFFYYYYCPLRLLRQARISVLN